jgi:hypothetical protein
MTVQGLRLVDSERGPTINAVDPPQTALRFSKNACRAEETADFARTLPAEEEGNAPPNDLH